MSNHLLKEFPLWDWWHGLGCNCSWHQIPVPRNFICCWAAKNENKNNTHTHTQTHTHRHTCSSWPNLLSKDKNRGFWHHCSLWLKITAFSFHLLNFIINFILYHMSSLVHAFPLTDNSFLITINSILYGVVKLND